MQDNVAVLQQYKQLDKIQTKLVSMKKILQNIKKQKFSQSTHKRLFHFVSNFSFHTAENENNFHPTACPCTFAQHSLLFWPTEKMEFIVSQNTKHNSTSFQWPCGEKDEGRENDKI